MIAYGDNVRNAHVVCNVNPCIWYVQKDGQR